jgi:hypothetical protein
LRGHFFHSGIKARIAKLPIPAHSGLSSVAKHGDPRDSTTPDNRRRGCVVISGRSAEPVSRDEALIPVQWPLQAAGRHT